MCRLRNWNFKSILSCLSFKMYFLSYSILSMGFSYKVFVIMMQLGLEGMGILILGTKTMFEVYVMRGKLISLLF